MRLVLKMHEEDSSPDLTVQYLADAVEHQRNIDRKMHVQIVFIPFLLLPAK